MSSNQDKARVSIAASPINKFLQHSSHITTSNFMLFDVAFARELPKGNYKFNHQTFVRTVPLKRPTFGAIQFYKSAYWVPFRTCWQPFTDFKTDTPHNQPNGTGIIPNVPLIDAHVLNALFFKDYVYSDDGISDSSILNGLYFYEDDTTTPSTYYQLNAQGRHAWKILHQLGYRWKPDMNSTSGQNTFSALPLLALAKCYIDWFYPNAYAHYGVYASLDGIFQRQVTYTLNQIELGLIFDVLYHVSYKSDYFTSAFQNPMTPTLGTFSTDYILKDISMGNSAYQSGILNSNGNGIGQNIYNTPNLRGTSSGNYSNPNYNTSVANLTQYALNSLHALSDMLQRYGLVGARALERYLADWGVALEADKLQRSIKLTDKMYPLQVGDVMSNADTVPEGNPRTPSGAVLGDYSGKAVAYSNDCNFDFSTTEFGMLFVINTIHPDGGYPCGVRRQVLHKTKLDFLTGDFDGLGTQPIELREMFQPVIRTSGDNQIFAFKPRYSEYAEDLDNLSGDFEVGNLKTGLLGWESYRQFSDKPGDDPFDFSISLDFLLGVDAAQYNRIFFDTVDDSDKFTLVHRANYEMHIPKKPVYDFYDFEDGKKILMDVNGVKSV